MQDRILGMKCLSQKKLFFFERRELQTSEKMNVDAYIRILLERERERERE